MYRPALQHVYLLEFHPSLALAARIPQALRHGFMVSILFLYFFFFVCLFLLYLPMISTLCQNILCLNLQKLQYNINNEMLCCF